MVKATYPKRDGETVKIGGFQKLTLLDYPGKVACLVFTKGCNLRCPFCHNASLVTHTQDAGDVTQEEILSYLQKRKGLLDGVCITGGEPLMQKGIEEFIAKVKELGYSVKLDTNGTFPDKLRELLDKKLVDYVAMDIKNCKEKYPATTGIQGFGLESVEKSLAVLKESGVEYELRTTVTDELHTPEDIGKIALWIKDTQKYFIQNFKDSGDIILGGLNPVSDEKLEEMLEKSALQGVLAQSR